MEHPGSVLLESALSVGSWDTQSLNDKDGGRWPCAMVQGRNMLPNHPGRMGRQSLPPANQYPVLFQDFPPKCRHKCLRWHPQHFPQQLLKFICSIKHTNVRMQRDEWAVEKKRTKCVQNKPRLKCSQPLPRALFVVSVGLGSFLGSPAASSLGTLR